jgi:hypothetical protein
MPPKTIGYCKESEMIIDLLHIEGIFVIRSPADVGSAAKGQSHGDSPVMHDPINSTHVVSPFVMPVSLCFAGIRE